MDMHGEIEELRGDLRQVRRDLKRLLANAGNTSRERVADTGARWWAGSKAVEDRVEERVMDALNEAREQARHAALAAKEEVEEHPFLIGLAVAGLALVVFSMMGRSAWRHYH
jgi:ElaB/YqjD/DUF883 family membrane-anchored ribosome-binding protein